MVIAFLTAILIFGVIVFVAWRLVKERTAEHKEREAEEMKKAAPDSDRLQ